eukprot:CCRYP_009651-RA/>CCRYP_009651-RA protein AED:0.45 eAED:0.99 QI:0/0/0/1/0/0/2/0/86
MLCPPATGLWVVPTNSHKISHQTSLCFYLPMLPTKHTKHLPGPNSSNSYTSVLSAHPHPHGLKPSTITSSPHGLASLRPPFEALPP